MKSKRGGGEVEEPQPAWPKPSKSDAAPAKSLDRRNSRGADVAKSKKKERSATTQTTRVGAASILEEFDVTRGSHSF